LNGRPKIRKSQNWNSNGGVKRPSKKLSLKRKPTNTNHNHYEQNGDQSPEESDSGEVTGQRNQRNPLAYPSLFWKMTKPKYLKANIMCDLCRDINFKERNKFQVKGNRLYVTESYCIHCTNANQSFSDIVIPPAPPSSPQ
jgi:hypothetical protein